MELREKHRLSWIERVGSGEISGVIYGTLANKSNSRRVFRTRKGRPIIVKAQAALDFVHKVKVIGSSVRARGGLRGATSRNDVRAGIPTLVLSAVIYGASWMRDLDVELLPDALQSAGVINNDRSIREKHYWWVDEPHNPRIEFTVRISEREA
jgi:hypothetical protein